MWLAIALLLALQQPPQGWRGASEPAALVVTRDTVIFAAPLTLTEAHKATQDGLESLFRRVAPRLQEIGVDVLRSDKTLIGWQDPKDPEKGGQIHLRPAGDFIGVILVSPGRLPDVREQPEACQAFLARLERYYQRRPAHPDPCE